MLFFLAALLNFWALERLNLGSNCESHSAGTKHHAPLNSCKVAPFEACPFPTLTAEDLLPELAQYSPMRFDAELGEPSIFKGPPSKQLDDAWNKLVDQPMILVDNETLQVFDPTSKPTKSIDGHYYATVEVYHQLHCLDITRKFIWRDHYQHVDTFQDPPEMVWEHVDHCIDLLRQVLMCNGDVGLIFYTDVGEKQPVARVSTSHMCRNFSQITDWVNRHDSELNIHAGPVDVN
ncbi:hypothetical protein O1611_g4596 [Lasiodiplodia mahajangana]|uniref:Uncharacterized protein n=1 Tax=Lasiodiplodia mahajangana TaxID=1108764 RepID=A0ACC2JND6_9PEZI|nr:hypothetical protein O1611_g4596 [Lasiodiplodia mahajangana]